MWRATAPLQLLRVDLGLSCAGGEKQGLCPKHQLHRTPFCWNISFIPATAPALGQVGVSKPVNTAAAYLGLLWRGRRALCSCRGIASQLARGGTVWACPKGLPVRPLLLLEGESKATSPAPFWITSILLASQVTTKSYRLELSCWQQKTQLVIPSLLRGKGCDCLLQLLQPKTTPEQPLVAARCLGTHHLCCHSSICRFNHK